MVDRNSIRKASFSQTNPLIYHNIFKCRCFQHYALDLSFLDQLTFFFNQRLKVTSCSASCELYFLLFQYQTWPVPEKISSCATLCHHLYGKVLLCYMYCPLSVSIKLFRFNVLSQQSSLYPRYANVVFFLDPSVFKKKNKCNN